jgi:lysophospholipase L1-like esterase
LAATLPQKKYFLIFGLISVCLVALSILLYQKNYTFLTFLSAILFITSAFLIIFRNASSNIKLALVTTFFMLIVIEIFFRVIFSSTLDSHAEANSNQLLKKYVSVYHREDETHLYNGKVNFSFCGQRKEFEHCRDFNEYGIPHSRSIDPWKSSILFLGDSFTEGQGAPEDSTYVSEMYNKLNKAYNCINGGLAGSDIFYEWALYKNKLAVLQPKVIIFLINSTDIYDVMIRGGEERFDPNSKPQGGPIWEPFYATSYIVRKVVITLGYNWLLKSPKQTNKEYLAAIEKLRSKISDISLESSQAGIKTLFILHPSDVECRLNRYDFKEFPEIIYDIPLHLKVNTLQGFTDNQLCDKIYWKHDRHFNPKGYNILAEVVFNNLGNEIEKAMVMEIPN